MSDTVLKLLAAAALLPHLAFAQDPGDAVRPTPRLPDGTVNLGPAPGETGHWDTGRGSPLMENAVDLDGPYLRDPDDADLVAPFKPWSRALFLARQANLGKDDPHPRCSGNGGPRMFDTPYGVDFIQDMQRERILVLVGWSRRWREIHMDGRGHPDLETYTPTFFGHSTGRWEGDALVVDTVGFNEKFWFARRPTGMVNTESLHLIERISRPNYRTLRYEVTIDDPEAYTRPWTTSWELPWTELEMVEYLCAENNLDPAHYVGPQ
ncbi:MAG TPA: hypothetical protein VIV14_08895 [Gammaproteobacteria bacterium]